MRRSTIPLLIAASALVAVGLTACGSDSDDPDSNAGSGETTAAEDSAFPVAIEHKYGTTEITEAPESVVTVGLTEQDALLALGVVPVATTKWFGTHPGEIFPWAEDALGDAPLPEVLEDEKQFEKVAALQPDLIVAMYSSITKEDYEKYAKIAPTLAAPDGYVDYGVPWQEATRIVGQAIGKADEADQLVDDVEDKTAQAAADNPEFEGKEAATVTIYEGIFIYGPEDPRGRLLTDLGFVYPETLSKELPEDFGGSISVENADLVDLDTLVWVNSAETTEKEVPQYKNLNVSKQGRDVFIPEDDPIYEATSFQSVLSVPYLLDGLVPRLAAAADGDPATSTDG